MLLQNLNINPEELPALEEVDFQALERDYLWLRLTAWSLFLLLAALICSILVFIGIISLWLWLPAWLLILMLVFVIEIKGFKIKGYALREKDISYKSGLIWFHMTSVPFNRIQHCEISQGLLDRLFRLSSVKVYTAGGSSSDLSINGLTQGDARKLRDFITRMSADYE